MLKRLNRKITNTTKDVRDYQRFKRLAKHYENKYLTANHWLENFRTQFAPGHFYSPYPDLKEIEKRKDTIFDRSKRPLPGIDIRESQQLKLLGKLAKHYDNLPYKPSVKGRGLRYAFGLHAYSYTDAIVLFCMMLEFNPERIVEIGSGYSSALMLDVNERFFDNSINLTFIEPYPELLRSLTRRTDAKNYTLISKPLWMVDDSVFSSLKKNDFLFIDSTHVSKAGSDVNQIFFEILPLLSKGVIVHIHDIFYPFEYPLEWVNETRAWNEGYLTRAFLYNNESYEIIFFNHFMNIHHEKELIKSMPFTKHNSGGSLWIRKVN